MLNVQRKLIFILLVIILFGASRKVSGQYFTKEKLLFFSSTILSSTLSGVTEGLQQREQHFELDPAKKLKLNKMWHITQTGERVSWIFTGVTIALDTKFNGWKMIGNLLTSAGIHWVLYDGLENALRNKPFFWVSNWQKENNTSLTDKFSTWQFKIGFLAATLILNYLLSTAL